MTSDPPADDQTDGVSRAYKQAQTLSIVERSASDEELELLARNWQDDEIPAMQRTVADIQLANLTRGIVDPVFTSLAAALKHVDRPRFSILDAACASGYYSEVIAALDPRPIDYAGCDYSPAMIEMARAHYPDLPFSVQDLTALTLEDRSVDVVLLAGVLEHIPDYRSAIDEATRVGREYLIVHRCPTTSTRGHERTIGTQYNIRTPRTFFAQKVLASEFAEAGFGLVASIDVYPKRRTLVQRLRRTISGWRGRRHRGTQTLVFRRRP